MSILFGVLKFLGVFLLLIVTTFVCKTFVFSKIRINKFIPLAISIILLLVEIILPFMKINLNFWINSIISILVIQAFLWFLEIHQTGGPKPKEKKIVIKSKPKPNRVKNNKK